MRVRRTQMKLCLAACAAVALLASGAPLAGAATMKPQPKKKCYRDKEAVNLAGEGFSPNSTVSIARDGMVFAQRLNTGPTGTFVGQLTLAQGAGQSRRTYTATDTTDTSVVARTSLVVSAIEVKVRPDTGTPGKVLRIGARGFTVGKTLYAHIVRKGKSRNERIGRLRGACSKVLAHKRLFSKRTKVGTYRVQFDNKRRYNSREEVKYAFTVEISVQPKAAASVWKPLR
jgi:hypothetical protein